jgi:ABC-type transport system involved in multi-copper enzyme maturation permease subunit
VKRIGLPLLSRELTEASARRMTYVFRVLLALALSIVGLCVLFDVISSRNPFRVLGHGRELLEAIVHTEFVYIYGLLPILSCGAFTEEKERNTLSLLLLTRLGPWTIVFEKILGRLVPTLAMIALSLPLLAFAYSLGGCSRSDLAGAAWLLLMGSLQVITISVMTSAYCNKTVSAFLLAWLVGVTTACIPQGLDEFGLVNIRLEEMMFAPVMFDSMLWRPLSLAKVMFVSIPTLISCAISMGLARYFLTRCETQTKKNPLSRLLAQLDVLVKQILERWSKGSIRLDSQRALPVDKPVYWRETNCDLINRPRYRAYVTIFGTIAVVVATLIGAEWEKDEGLAAVYFCFLSVVALTVVSKSAALFASERSRQTLDILLCTPLTGRQIVLEKMSAIYRLMLTFAIPFLVLLLIDGLLKQLNGHDWFKRRRYGEFAFGIYFVSSFVTVAIYLPMLSWLAAIIGMRTRKQTTALIWSLAGIFTWALLPMFVAVGIFEAIGVRPGDDAAVFLLASPLPFFALNEVVEVHQLLPRNMPIVLLFAINTAIYGAALLGLRWLCLSQLDWLMKRSDSG